MSATPARRRATLAAGLTLAIIGCFYALYAASTVSLLLAMRQNPHSVMTATQPLPQSDFAIFWSAGTLLAVRAADRFGLHLPLSVWYQHAFPIDILAAEAPITLAWPYPPPMGLLVMPFAFIPLAASFWVWRVFSLAAATLLLRRAGLLWFPILAGLFSPAALHDAVGGQNGTLTGALLVSSLLLIGQGSASATKDHAKVGPMAGAKAGPMAGASLGGGLAGLLIIKPQLALALPFVLLHRHRARPLAWCLATVAALAVASALVEGGQSWIYFLHVAQPDSLRAANQPFAIAFPAAGITVFTMLRSLHAGTTAAWAGQAVAAAIALGLIWQLWRGPLVGGLKPMAVTVCLLILAMPHGFAYDLVGYSVAMAALFAGTAGWRRLAFGVLWLLGGYTITVANLTGLLPMPLAAAAGAWLAWTSPVSEPTLPQPQ